jgi:hypothetical protein
MENPRKGAMWDICVRTGLQPGAEAFRDWMPRLDEFDVIALAE